MRRIMVVFTAVALVTVVLAMSTVPASAQTNPCPPGSTFIDLSAGGGTFFCGSPALGTFCPAGFVLAPPGQTFGCIPVPSSGGAVPTSTPTAAAVEPAVSQGFEMRDIQAGAATPTFTVSNSPG